MQVSSTRYCKRAIEHATRADRTGSALTIKSRQRRRHARGTRHAKWFDKQRSRLLLSISGPLIALPRWRLLHTNSPKTRGNNRRYIARKAGGYVHPTRRCGTCGTAASAGSTFVPRVARICARAFRGGLRRGAEDPNARFCNSCGKALLEGA